MRRRMRFSLLTLFYVTTAVAVSIFVSGILSELWKTQRKLTSAKRSVAGLEKLIDLERERDEKDYFGVHGDPIVAIDLHSPDISPRLLKILNTKHLGQSLNMRVRDGGGFSMSGFGVPTIPKNEPPGRRIGINVRLLRSLNNHDYYRLVYHPSNFLDGTLGSANGKEITHLFQYDGKPQLLAHSDSMSIAAGPTAESALEVLVGTYPPEEADGLRAFMNAEDGSFNVLTMFHPSGR